MEKARRSLRYALWECGLTEPLHQKDVAALLMRKHLYNLSDERVVAQWEKNPYFQYLAGEATFRWIQPWRLVSQSTLDTAWEKKA